MSDPLVTHTHNTEKVQAYAVRGPHLTGDVVLDFNGQAVDANDEGVLLVRMDLGTAIAAIDVLTAAVDDLRRRGRTP